MRAALLNQVKQPLEIVHDLELRPPRRGEVRVEIAHCGICRSDVSIADGMGSTLPLVLGHEAAGRVAEVGEDVTSLSPGDKVVLTPAPSCGRCYWCRRGEFSICVEAVQGIAGNIFKDGSTGLSRGDQVVYRGLGVAGFADHAVVVEQGAVRVPEETPLSVACLIGCAVQTGVGAVLNTAQVEEGDTVLVTGAGGIGLSVVQGAVLASASRIIVSDPIPARREMARRLGATDLLDPAEGDIAAAALDLTDGIGVDYAFEAAGVARLLSDAFNATRNGGTVTAVGIASADQALQLESAALFAFSSKKLVGCLLGGCNGLRDIPRLLGLWRSGRLELDAMISGHRPLEEINQGFDDVRAGLGLRTVIDL